MAKTWEKEVGSVTASLIFSSFLMPYLFILTKCFLVPSPSHLDVFNLGFICFKDGSF